jgi:hypothetical protein
MAGGTSARTKHQSSFSGPLARHGDGGPSFMASTASAIARARSIHRSAAFPNLGFPPSPALNPKPPN